MKCPLCGRNIAIETGRRLIGLDPHTGSEVSEDFTGPAEPLYSDLMGELHCWDCHEAHYRELMLASAHLPDFEEPVSRRRPA